MKIYYLVISSFLTFFYSRQITNLICFGRHRDQEFVKSKKVYYLIYIFWILFFGILCLMMGSASGVDHTFDYGLNVIELYSGNRSYFTGKTIYDENDYNRQGDFTIEYYVKNNDNIESISKKIVEENGIIYRMYNLSNISIIYESNNRYLIYENEEVFATVDVEKTGVVKKLSFHWKKEMLRKNKGG